MLRLRKTIAIVCVGLVLFAAFTPGVAAHHIEVLFEPVWSVFAPQTTTFAPLEPVPAVEQTRGLVSPLFSRPPPLPA